MSTFSSSQTTIPDLLKPSKLPTRQLILQLQQPTTTSSVNMDFLTDRGTQFEGFLFTEVCKVAKITKLRTTSYHPQCNSNSERFNSTLINMIKTLEYEDKVQLTKHLNTLCSAYNSTLHSSTGFSLHWLMMGRKPRLEHGNKLARAWPNK